MSKEAMKLALEVLEAELDPSWNCNSYHPKIHTAMTALREALAEQSAQQQEPICKLFGTLPVYDRAAQQEQNRQIDQLIQERDHRDEIIDKLCDAVLGPDRYEWSSQYFFEDAVREVEERMAEQPAQQEPVGCAGAIVNGRVYADRLEHDYKFECEAGPLHLCNDWVEFRRCFEWLAQHTSPPAQRKPLTDHQTMSMTFNHHWLTSMILRDAYRLGIRDAEATHGITKGQK